MWFNALFTLNISSIIVGSFLNLIEVLLERYKLYTISTKISVAVSYSCADSCLVALTKFNEKLRVPPLPPRNFYNTQYYILNKRL